MSAEPLTIAGLARALRDGTTTAEAATERCLETIAARDPEINAFIAVVADAAREQAREADRALAVGSDRGLLHGVPVSLKDLLDLRGMPTTAGSRVRRTHVAAEDATVVARLREAGAVFIGKTNLHEFAFGTTNEDSAYGPVRHPLDARRSPGGSSGGSAASVLAGMALASVGTDTGGSIRIPSAACGLVGLKPGVGEIPTTGVVPLSSTMDHVGPLCRSVEDAAALFAVLRRAPLEPAPDPRPDRIRLGVPREYFLSRLDPGVARAFDEACDRLRQAGATIEDVRIPTQPTSPPSIFTSSSPRPLRTTGPRSTNVPRSTRRRCACASKWAATCSARTTPGRCTVVKCCNVRSARPCAARTRCCCPRCRCRPRRSAPTRCRWAKPTSRCERRRSGSRSSSM